MGKIVITSPSAEEIRGKGVTEWPVWEKGISRFAYEYDADEECFILSGEVTVETSEGVFSIKPGDFVTFRKGLQCLWNITQPVRKHYNFPYQ